MIGAQIENYRIVEKLGDGGMGSVYKAVDVMLERDVALKFLRPELAEQPDLVERFRSEAVVLAKLTHQNVAGLYGLHRHGNEFFMAMEFVPGQTIETLLKQSGKLPVERATAIAIHILHALEYAHRHGVVHRDIKSANVIVTPAGGVKVMDFGIARVLGTERRTRVGFVVGTIGYMAPEQIQGLDVDGRTDIYAVGVVLYEMLTARMPFQGETEYAVMQAQVQQMPVPPRVFAEMPQALEACVMRALAKQPADRFQSAVDFVEALQVAMRQGPGTVTSGSGSFATPGEETREFKSDPALLAAGFAPRTPAPPPAVVAPAWPATPPATSSPTPPALVPPASPPSPPPYWPPAPDLTVVRPTSPPTPSTAPPPLPVTPVPPPASGAPVAPVFPAYTPPSSSPMVAPPITPPVSGAVPAPVVTPVPAPASTVAAAPAAPAAPVPVAAPRPAAPMPVARPSQGLPAPIVALFVVLAVLGLGGAGFWAWQRFLATRSGEPITEQTASVGESTAAPADTQSPSAPAPGSAPSQGPPADATAAGQTAAPAPGAITTPPAPPGTSPSTAAVPATPRTGRTPRSTQAPPKPSPVTTQEPAVIPIPAPAVPPPPLEPARPALPPVRFDDAKWMRVEGTRMREVDILLQVSDDGLRLLDRRTRGVLLTVPFSELSVAQYSQGKRARWRSDLGPAPAATVFDDTVRTFHYVAFQGGSRFVLVRVDRDDLTRLRDELQKRSSLTLDVTR